MKKLSTLIFCSLFFTIFLSANDLIISGLMTRTDGSVVPDIEVNIAVKLGNVDMETFTVYTDENGEFEVTYKRDANLRIIQVEVSYLDCLGSKIVKNKLVFQNQSSVHFDLNYCARNTDAGCSVSILQNRSPIGLFVYIAVARGTEPFTYEWSNGSTEQRTFGFPNQHLCVTITDSNGCTATACIGEPRDCSVTINVNETPLGTILTATPNRNDAVSYEWNNGQTGQFARILESGTYCVKVTFSDGCIAENCVTIERDDDEDKDCIDARLISVVNTDSSAVMRIVLMQNIPVVFEWNTGDSTSFLEITESGTYSVTITDARNDSCFVVFTQTIILDDNGCQVALVAVENEDGYSLSIIGGVAPGQVSPLVFWSTGDEGPELEVTKDTATFCAQINFILCRTEICIDIPVQKEEDEEEDDDDNLHVNLSLAKLLNQGEINVFPNPAQDKINLSFFGSGDADIYLMDGTGRINRSFMRQNLGGDTTFELDLSTLIPGIYFIQIRMENEILIKKFIKN